MTTKVESYRVSLATLDLTKGQTVLVRLIRRAARNRTYIYAHEHKIVDYADTLLTDQKHRDFRQNTINAALTKVDDANATTTIAENLAVFDDIKKWLE